MDIIPVIDLKGGTVVHARRGARETYRPLETPLSPTSAPLDVVAGLLALFPFATLYVADLDAIAGGASNAAVLQRIMQAHPRLTLWVDNGIADAATATDWLGQNLGHLVLGSETQRDTSTVRRFQQHPRVVLSLDHRSAAFQGPAELLAAAEHWPQRVIAMTLDRVGSDAGPDLQRLRAIRADAGSRAVYAAGGIRNAADLRELAQIGIAGALVASSLHNGRITAADLGQFSPRQAPNRG